MSDSYPQSRSTVPHRKRERMSRDKDLVRRVFDESWTVDVAFTGGNGEPRVLPMFHVRVGDRLYLHWSSGSRLGLTSEDGIRVSVSATLLDGLVLAKSWTNHSMNYRCAIAHGTARPVLDDDEAWDAMKALVDRVEPGRSDRTRGPSAKEWAEVRIFRLDLEEVAVKRRVGGVGDESADADVEVETGIMPVETVVSPLE
ncbi:pyridoxamine 5'-phosphate oxidase family protein [Salininema proteolyticum]|uniref:Pyridoxamine 5'-phosphate oxidase family protein n=1 Tax=Salininema proteolyticum TaxID=1607685 RepID=A0ABV8TSM0_9ACTN